MVDDGWPPESHGRDISGAGVGLVSTPHEVPVDMGLVPVYPPAPAPGSRTNRPTVGSNTGAPLALSAVNLREVGR